jgi:hypothetical protein
MVLWLECLTYTLNSLGLILKVNFFFFVNPIAEQLPLIARFVMYKE